MGSLNGSVLLTVRRSRAWRGRRRSRSVHSCDIHRVGEALSSRGPAGR